jgi:MarR family transcriptional regulator, negative regulator of the multidrug operon emrRAB
MGGYQYGRDSGLDHVLDMVPKVYGAMRQDASAPRPSHTSSRKPSHEDKRSVVLCVSPQGEKCLAQHDPINPVLYAVTTLDSAERIRLRDSLRGILNHLDATHQRLNARVCRHCMFPAERSAPKGRAGIEYTSRLYRAPISPDEIELLCASFERATTG